MEKIKVGIVNYLNTRPLVYGIENSPVMNEIIFTGNYPAKLAQQLITGEIDLGLVPIAVIPGLREHFINTDYCIGTEGEVASVCLFSDVPLEEAETVLMDYQSRTSVALAKLLLKEYWKLTPEIVPTQNDYRPLIAGRTAGLVIGDRALEQRHKNKYIYDLGTAWKDHTGLPFVFAAWVSTKKLDPGFVAAFNEANRVGLTKIHEVVSEQIYEHYDLLRYYTRNISYLLTENKRVGLASFLNAITK
ncbi:menaquinone biosynthetic enzyme MqnA/MqnD family protein [Flavitalea antarctica]